MSAGRAQPEVVITGLGVVSPFGCGRQALADGLAAGMARATVIERRARFHRRRGSRLVLAADTADLERLVPAIEARRMSLPSRMAVAAARLALADAGLAPRFTSDDGNRTAVVMATTFGPPGVTEGLLEAIFGAGPQTASPFIFPESVASAPAAQVAIALGVGGANITVTQRSAGPLLALGRARALLAAGRVERVIVGAFDEANPLLHAVLDRFRALATAGAGLTEAARPFDRRRNGFMLGEGASALVVELSDAARARGAAVLARLGPSLACFDPTAPAHGWGDGGDAIGDAVIGGMARAGIDPGTIVEVVSGASGARAGDRLEAAVLRRIFGARLPRLRLPKAVVGEHGGGFLAAAVLAAAGSALPGSVEDLDPQLGIDTGVFTGGAPGAAAGARLATAVSAGGAATFQVLLPA